jgi:ubiquinol oxidase
MASKRASAQLLKTFNGLSTSNMGVRPAFIVIHPAGRQHFSSSSSSSSVTEFFPKKETAMVRRTEAAWPHPIYTPEQMNAVVVAHREAKTWSDKVALLAVKVLRYGLDVATGKNKYRRSYIYSV